MNFKVFFLTGAFALSSFFAKAQCNHDWDIDVTLTELQIVRFSSKTLSGELTAISFDVAFEDIDGGSWPSDLLVHVYAPNGNCVVWGGFNGMNIDGGCQNLGTGNGGAWPDIWNSDGTIRRYQITKSIWQITTLGELGHGPSSFRMPGIVRPFRSPCGTATWDMDITWFGVCAGDCLIPTACNYNPSAELANNDICIFAEELYPSGLYDCDGNCYNDDDGDGICNELEVPGCQVVWACNYNELATDPPRQ